MSTAPVLVEATRDDLAGTRAPELPLLRLLRRDLGRYQEFHRRDAREVSRVRIVFESLVFKAGFQAVLLHRVAHAAGRLGLTYLAWAIARFNQLVTGADIEFSTQIGPGLLIVHPSGVVIGRGTVIGVHATIYQGVTCGVRNWGPGRGRLYPHVGHYAVLFARATILGGIRVGHRTIVGAHALLLDDVPDGALVDGSPARIRPGLGDQMLRRWGL